MSCDTVFARPAPLLRRQFATGCKLGGAVRALPGPSPDGSGFSGPSVPRRLREWISSPIQQAIRHVWLTLVDSARSSASNSPALQKLVIFANKPGGCAGVVAFRTSTMVSTGSRPLLSVIIPCFNEAATILDLIERVRQAPVPSKQLIIVDDGSSDGTRELLSRLNAPDLTILMHERNQGKGAALATGFAAAEGEICIVQDADLEYDPNEFPLVIGPIVEGKADVVFGSRFQGAAPHRVVYFWHRMGNGFLTLMSNMFTDLNLTDMETCYKAFRTEIIQSIPIREKRFGFEPEITAKVAKRRCRIYEVGISYYGRTYDEGKKIGWKDGIRAIWCIIKYNLTSR